MYSKPIRAKHKAFAEIRDLKTDLENSDLEMEDISKWFGLKKAVIITAFAKREAGSDRWLFQPTPSYDLRAQVILHPYMHVWHNGDKKIAVSHSELPSLDDILSRVSEFSGKDMEE